ncbi:MAG: hypothetical protein WD875_18445 [Pirellulales bacterium]
MDASGGLRPSDVFAILGWIVVGLILVGLLGELIDKRRFGEVFIGVCVLVAGLSISRAIGRWRL